jgi:hypothetical protein
MTLEELIGSIDRQTQFELALDLTERTLPIWNAYAESNKLEYTDTVVGMHHVVRKDILFRTLETIRGELANSKTQKHQIEQLTEEFRDPIVAMQDFDWGLPYSAEKTFYALKNFLDALNGREITIFGDSQIYLVINQAIDALMNANVLTEIEIRDVLDRYRNSAQRKL